MPTWMEIRCEAQKEPKSYNDRCWSYDNNGPHGMASDNQASVLSTLRSLNEQAKKSGWQRTQEGWVCPHCVT
jgi:hypothetical protein